MELRRTRSSSHFNVDVGGWTWADTWAEVAALETDDDEQDSRVVEEDAKKGGKAGEGRVFTGEMGGRFSGRLVRRSGGFRHDGGPAVKK